MTKEEVIQILTKIKSAYPQNFTNISYEQGTKMINDWHYYLKDYSFSQVNAKLDEHIRTSVYIPKIADLTNCNKIAGNKFANYEQNNQCTKEEWDNMVDLYNRFYHKDVKNYCMGE